MKRFASAYNTINLLRNGGWDFVGTTDEGQPDLHFWALTNLVPEADTQNADQNFFTVADNVLGITLHSPNASLLAQSFDYLGTFDFTTPLAAGLRSSQPSGYQTDRQQVLPAGNYTVAFDFTGIAQVRVHLINSTGTVTSDWQTGDTRLVFNLETTALTDDVVIEIQRLETLTTATISRIMMAAGSYSALPYTGEPLSIFPKGTIIMSCGASCPSGFEELGEDDLSPLSAWQTDDPGINARKGNYPRSGTELYGDVKHTGGSFLPSISGIDHYEGYNSYLSDTYSVDPRLDIGTAEYAGFQVDQVFSHDETLQITDPTGEHTHTIKSGGTRPVAVKMRFCRRL